MRNIFFIFVFFVFMGSAAADLSESPFDKEVEEAIQKPNNQHLFSKYAKTESVEAMRLYKEGTYLIEITGKSNKEERIKEGMNRLQKALEFDPNFAAVHLSLGQAFISTRHITKNLETRKALVEKAKDEYEKALELDPNNPDVHRIIAWSSNNRNKRIYHNRKALELDPEQDIDTMDRAYIAESMGKVNEAFEYLVQELKWTPVNDRCREVKNVKTLPAEEYGFSYFKKKYPKQYAAFVKRVCRGERMPEYEYPGGE